MYKDQLYPFIEYKSKYMIGDKNQLGLIEAVRLIEEAIAGESSHQVNI